MRDRARRRSVHEAMYYISPGERKMGQAPSPSGALWRALASLPGRDKMSGRAGALQEFRPGLRCSEKRCCFPAAARRSAAFAVLALALVIPIRARAATAQTTQTLEAVISPLGGLFSFPNAVTLTKTGTNFTNYAGSLTVQYDARTTPSGSGGSITVKATADFAPSGGPSIASPPSTGDALKYTCSGATQGAGCSGTQTVSTTTSTSVVTIPVSECTGGGGSCSSASPNTVTLNFTLTDDPKYSVGSYSATLTFTISAT
jgi:hypothetical protein